MSHQIVPKVKVNHGRKSRVEVAWGGVSVTPPPQKTKLLKQEKVKNFILVSSQIVPTKGGGGKTWTQIPEEGG